MDGEGRKGRRVGVGRKKNQEKRKGERENTQEGGRMVERWYKTAWRPTQFSRIVFYQGKGQIPRKNWGPRCHLVGACADESFIFTASSASTF